MPIEALAALIATGFCENTESTLPVVISISESTPPRPPTSIVVCERMRSASLPTTMTAWLDLPVETRSPRFTGVPMRAGRPFTSAEPSMRFTPGGMSPLASAREITPPAPAAPNAPLAISMRSIRLRPDCIDVMSGPGEEDVPHRVAEIQAAALELGLGAPRGAGCISVGGVAQSLRGTQHREHMLGIVLPIRGHVQEPVRDEPRGGQGGELRLQQAALVVALLGPRVGKEKVDRRERRLGNHVAEDFHGVVLDDAHVGDAAGFELFHQAAHPRRVDLDREVVVARIRGRDPRRGLSHAETDLRDHRSAPAEDRGEIERRAAIGEPQGRQERLVGALLPTREAALAQHVASDRRMGPWGGLPANPIFDTVSAQA